MTDLRRRLRAYPALVCCLLLAAAGVTVASEPPLAPLSDGSYLALPELDPSVPAPASVLGHAGGARLSHWEPMRRYLDVLAGASERVRVADYGTTYEGRPLTLVTVTSPANQARIDEILATRALLADPAGLDEEERRRLAREEPVVVWLGYGVHGDESSSSEAAIAAAYLLAAAGGEWPRLLEQTVVVIDPLENPDGRERYVSGFEQRRGRAANPDPAAAEHFQPWPGGRYNHYLFDLNRDWSWATQRETRQRLAAYRRWMPQVFVDLHEMSADSTYFFPPPAEPVNPDIAPQVVRWLEVFGAGNAAAFDRQQWLYFNAERFDLFYPGYGDSYPSLQGAVGMTYEVGGGGRGGEALVRSDGTLLTLSDRVARHLTASLATVRTAAAHRQGLLADFIEARRAWTERPAVTYLWPAAQPEAATLAATLARHGIRVGRVEGEPAVAAHPLGGGETAERWLGPGAWTVSTAQPLGNLVRTLLEPETAMPAEFLDRQRERIAERLDPEFYDLTAWSLPLALDLEVWVAAGLPPDAVRPVEIPGAADPERELTAGAAGGGMRGEAELGWLVPPSGLAGYRLATRLLAEGVRCRVALAGFDADGHSFPAGTLFVPRRDNPETVERALAEAAAEAGVEVRGVGSSRTAGGPSLGSDRFPSLAPARVGLIGGDGVSPTSFGALWHLLDRQLGLPFVRLDLGSLERVDLAGLGVVILPDGEYELADPLAESVERWVRGGGVLVAVGGAIDWLQERELTTVADWGDTGDEGDDPEAPGTTAEPPPEVVTPGAILATRLRTDHPLAAGLATPPPVLFEGSTTLVATGDPRHDVLVADPDRPVLAGVVWPEARERLAGALLVGTERVGRGRLVLFAQEPGYRQFWRGTLPLLLNAVLYAPSWGVDPRY
jgi:hypothetical protein